jgi:hypothetical protein
MFINYVLYKLGGENNPLNFFLFAIPLSLFISRKSENRLLAMFWAILWLVYAGMTLNMRRHPFCRNMNFHYSFSLAMMLFTFFLIVKRITAFLKSETGRDKIVHFSYLVPIFCLAIYFLKSQKEEANFWLYFNDANVVYKELSGDARFVSAQSTVACSNESFMIFYCWGKMGIKMTKCSSGAEDFYVKLIDEPLPAQLASGYQLEKKLSEKFELWKKMRN